MVLLIISRVQLRPKLSNNGYNVTHFYRIKSRFSGLSSFDLEPAIPLPERPGPPLYSDYDSNNTYVSTPTFNKVGIL